MFVTTYCTRDVQDGFYPGRFYYAFFNGPAVSIIPAIIVGYSGVPLETSKCMHTDATKYSRLCFFCFSDETIVPLFLQFIAVVDILNILLIQYLYLYYQYSILNRQQSRRRKK